MAKDGVRDSEQIKAYPRGNAQGGRALQAVRGSMDIPGGTEGSRTVIRETTEGRAIARTRDRMPMVEVESREAEYYEESGQLFTGSMGASNPNRFDAGTWYLRNCPPQPWQGRIDKDGLQEILYVANQGSEALPSAMKTVNESLYTKKKCVYYAPASLFTGRTRLWVQALYGAEFTGTWDFSLSVTLVPELAYTAGTTSFIIGSTPMQTTIIYFDAADPSWWYVQLTDKVSVSPMIPADGDDFAHDNLIDLYVAARDAVDPPTPPDELTRIEAYILGRLLPDTKNKFDLVGTLPSVSPIAYGWKSSKDGHKFATVSVSSTTGPGLNDNRFVSRVYEGTITRAPLLANQTEKDRWSFSCNQTEGPAEWTSLFGISNVWTPAYTTLSTGTPTVELIRYEENSYANRFNFSGVPIYCFFEDDDLKVARYGFNETGAGTEVEVSPADAWVDADMAFYINGPDLHGERIVRETSAAYSFTHDLGNGGAEAKSWSGYESQLNVDVSLPDWPGSFEAAIAGGVWGWFGYLLPITPTSAGYGIYEGATAAGLNCEAMTQAAGTTVDEQRSVTQYVRGALVVPADDCECVYSQKYSYRGESGILHYDGKISSNAQPAQAVYCLRQPKPDTGYDYLYPTSVAYKRVRVDWRYDDVLVLPPNREEISTLVLCNSSSGSEATLGAAYSSLVNPDRGQTTSGDICRTRFSFGGDHASTELPSTGAEPLQTFVGGA